MCANADGKLRSSHRIERRRIQWRSGVSGRMLTSPPINSGRLGCLRHAAWRSVAAGWHWAACRPLCDLQVRRPDRNSSCSVSSFKARHRRRSPPSFSPLAR